jgi:hypothetical protein
VDSTTGVDPLVVPADELESQEDSPIDEAVAAGAAAAAPVSNEEPEPQPVDAVVAPAVESVEAATVVAAADEVSAPLDSRLRNAVTSPPVETMLTTVHPSADFSVSFVASAAGSYEDELTVVNSCMGRDANAIVKTNRPA